MNNSVKNTLVAVGTLAAIGSTSVFAYNAGTTKSVESVSSAHTCNLRALKGTYSFDATGFAPALPPGLLQDENGVVQETNVDFSDSTLTVIALHAIGHVEFDGNGHHKGYIHENVGGAFEPSVPFSGTYTIEPGPNNVGCTGTWILQDDHAFFPFSEEGPHVFKVALAPESKGFHYIHVALGGSGQATLSGWAPLAYK
jgi:hypothetical protein